MKDPESHAIREAFLSSLPTEAIQHGDVPPARQFLHIPQSHVRALSPDNMLVEGMRGAGKSLWWAALQSQPHRELVASVLNQPELSQNIQVSPGFGVAPNPDAYPGKQTLRALLETHEPQAIWRTVLACQLWDSSVVKTMGEQWAQRVSFMAGKEERIERLFFESDRRLSEKKQVHLVVFDALDRTADGWEEMTSLLKGLLQVVLELRAYRALRAKVFVRPDMLHATEVTAFPDGNKLLQGKVELAWPKVELYSLLWQHLGNAAEGSDAFRRLCEDRGRPFAQVAGGIWMAPRALRRLESVQAQIFHELTGPHMRKDGPKGGIPYKWLPGHLGDSRGQVSPRSFLSALRKAAEETPLDHKRAIHFNAIKSGVQTASQIRVGELVREEFPWIDVVMKPLRRLTIPAPPTKLIERWEEESLLKTLKTANRKPPRIREGYNGLLKDLEELAIVTIHEDGRINMPDVFRVGFGLGRHGGIKPVR